MRITADSSNHNMTSSAIDERDRIISGQKIKIDKLNKKVKSLEEDFEAMTSRCEQLSALLIQLAQRDDENITKQHESTISKEKINNPTYETSTALLPLSHNQKKKQDMQEGMLEFCRRSVKNIEEVERKAISTAHDLVAQRKQIEELEEKLNSVHCSLDTSEKHIKNINGGFFIRLFKKPLGKKNASTNYSRIIKSENFHKKCEIFIEQKEKNDSTQISILNDTMTLDEKVTDHIIDVCYRVSLIKHFALSIAHEANDQMEMLSQIQQLFENTDGRIKQITQDIKKKR
jgi:hypothetical protein